MARAVLIIIALVLFPALKSESQVVKPDDYLSNAMGDTAYISKLIQTAWDNNPSNRVFESRVRIAEDEVSLKKNSWFNTLSLNFQYFPPFVNEVANNNIDYRFGVGVSFNFGALFTIPLQISQTKERMNIDNYNLLLQRNFIRAEVTRRYSTYITSLKIQKINNNAFEDVLSSIVLIKYKFEKGEETLDNYNKALSAMSEKAVTKVKSEGDVILAKASLEELLGKKLEEIE